MLDLIGGILVGVFMGIGAVALVCCAIVGLVKDDEANFPPEKPR